MLFQHFTFALGIIFFAVLVFYAGLFSRGRTAFSKKEKSYLLLPPCVALLLFFTEVSADTVHCKSCPADILSSLLLMALMRQYSVSGQKSFSILAYALASICLIVGAVRVLVFDDTVYVRDAEVFYPLFIGTAMLLFVIFYVRMFMSSKQGKRAVIPKKEEVFSYILFVSLFFFVLILSIYGILLGGVKGLIFYAVATVAVSVMYFLLFHRYVEEVKNPRLSASPVLSPSALVADDKSGKSDAVKELYDRIVELFDTDKPYLIDGITVSEVARMLFTNKVYVSRAINDYTGKNFCQFVNYYRVKYAVKMFNGNPYLKVGDLSDMSGFHTQVSFNMAFRLIMNDSPSEWCRKVRIERNCADGKN